MVELASLVSRLQMKEAIEVGLCINLLSYDSENIVHIVRGTQAPRDTKTDLQKTKEVGEKRLIDFVARRF